MKAEDANVAGEFQRRTTTQGSFGHEGDTWTKVCDAALEIRTLSLKTREVLAGAGQTSVITHTISTRYNDQLLPMIKVHELRIKLGTRLFNIHGGSDFEERHTWMVFECTEGTLDGQ